MFPKLKFKYPIVKKALKGYNIFIFVRSKYLPIGTNHIHYIRFFHGLYNRHYYLT